MTLAWSLDTFQETATTRPDTTMPEHQDNSFDLARHGTPLMACEHCDTLYREPTLTSKEVSICRRCGQVLLRGGTPDANTTFALTITALIVYVFANVYPVVVVEVQGRHNETTLWQAVAAMSHGFAIPAAVVIGLSMIVIPLVQILLLGWVTAYARTGRPAPGFRGALRALDYARPWSMVEVFLLGALVAIVKLSSLLEVKPGVGIISLLGLTFLLTLLAGRSTRGLWKLSAPHATPAPNRTPDAGDNTCEAV